MIVSNGKRVGAAYKTVISHDGATVNSGNGKRLTSLDRWSMVWDGYHFAPPPAGCVLYLPGNPGVGSTITDFSRSFSDSGINTNEALDDSELDVDVSADPTSVISTGDVIRIEDELMYVTSSASPILVLRGWDGSHAATHTTAKDIYVRTKNDGTITGATWRHLPSGLPYLYFDGDDDYIAIPNTATELDFTTENFAWMWWIKWGAPAQNSYLIGAGTSNVDGYYARINANGSITVVTSESAAKVTTTTAGDITAGGDWCLVGFIRTGTSIRVYKNNAELSRTVTGVHADPISTTIERRIGIRSDNLTDEFLGGIALSRAFATNISAATFFNIYQQERHLFGV